MLRALFIGLPGLTFLLGVPLALNLVPPNRFYGFRTQTTFASLEAWYQVNFMTGLALIAAGLVGAAAAFLLSQGITELKAETRYLAGILVSGVAVLLSLLPVVIYSNKF